MSCCSAAPSLIHPPCPHTLQVSMAAAEGETDPSLRRQQAAYLQQLKANLEDQV